LHATSSIACEGPVLSCYSYLQRHEKEKERKRKKKERKEKELKWINDIVRSRRLLLI
jgi:hypothetical protein